MTPSHHLDAHWYDRYKEESSLDHMQLLRADDGQQELFLRSIDSQPTFTYDGVDTDAARANIKALEQLKKDLASETNDAIRELYLELIRMALHWECLLLAVDARDEAAFAEHDRVIYGDIDETIFWTCVDSVRREAERLGSEAGNKLMRLLPALPAGQQLISVPTDDEFSDVEAAFRTHFDLLLPEELRHQKDFQPLSAEAAAKLITEQLQEIARSWSAETDEDHLNMATQAGERLILIPEDREFETYADALKLGHEMMHAYGAMNGERSPVLLGRSGYPGYGATEEGLATAAEQIWSGQIDDYARTERYLAIGYVRGVDGTKRTFRELYDLLEALFAVRIGLGTSDSAESAADQAWTLAQRIFRGTSGRVAGLCLGKDQYYTAGNVAIWRLFIDHPEAVAYARVSKYNPTDPRHGHLLMEQGLIKPADRWWS